MAQLRVRAAREADVPAIRRFVPAPMDWSTVISAAGAIVVTDDDAVVGVLVRWPHPAHVLVELLRVAPAARRKGVGTALLDVAEQEAILAGVNAVRALGALGGGAHDPFLRRSGFVEVDDGVLEKRREPHMP